MQTAKKMADWSDISAFSRLQNALTGTPAQSAATVWSQRVVVQPLRSEWYRMLEARFNELTALPRGWDGYDGRPVNFSCANFAASTLERLFIEGISPPALVPGSDGTMQMEWHRNGFDIELDVLGPNHVVATRYNHHDGAEEVLEIENDFSRVVTWIREIAQRKANIDAAAS